MKVSTFFGVATLSRTTHAHLTGRVAQNAVATVLEAVQDVVGNIFSPIAESIIVLSDGADAETIESNSLLQPPRRKSAPRSDFHYRSSLFAHAVQISLDDQRGKIFSRGRVNVERPHSGHFLVQQVRPGG